MINHFHKLFSELVREGGIDCGVVSITVTEPTYNRLLEDAAIDRRFYENSWRYGSAIRYQFYNYSIEIKPHTVDRELKEIWNGERKVCL